MRTVEKGCPICGSDVKGSKESRFYCEKCNVLYSEKQLQMKKQ